MVKTCPFCEIAAGRGEASVFYKDNVALGLMDIAPITQGHALVIPRSHSRRLADLDPAVGKQLFAVAQQTAAALRAVDLRCEGINLFLADGQAANQDVDHVHIHVIPRYQNDGFRIETNWGKKPSRSELDDVAAQIRQHLAPPDQA